MSLAKQAQEKTAISDRLKTIAKEEAAKKGGGTAAMLGVTGLAGAGLYGAHKLRQAAAGRKAHDRMKQHAGREYKDLSPEQKQQADKYFHAIKKHSPTLAGDPMAAWNTVQSFVKLPTSYGPGSIEQLQKIEKGKPSLFKRD